MARCQAALDGIDFAAIIGAVMLIAMAAAAAAAPS